MSNLNSRYDDVSVFLLDTEFVLRDSIENIENIAVNHSIKERRRLVEKYGEGRWFKAQGYRHSGTQ